MLLISNLSALSGSTQFTEQKQTEETQALAIYTTASLAELQNEIISIWIERSGTNEEIATKIPLKNLILAATYGESAVTSFPDLEGATIKTAARIEIGKEGAIKLKENELLKVEMLKLNPNKRYRIDTIGAPITTEEPVFYTSKVIGNDELSRKWEVKDFDLAVINNFSAIDYIEQTFGNGSTVKYNATDLRLNSLDVDPIQLVNNADGTLQAFSDEDLVLPLDAVTDIKIYKNTGVVPVTLYRDEKFS